MYREAKEVSKVKETLQAFVTDLHQGEETVYSYLNTTNQELHDGVTKYLGQIHMNAWIKSVKEIEKNLMKSKQPLSQKAMKKEKEKWNATENK